MDENGTLDLSMKKNRPPDKAAPLTSSNTSIPTPSSSPFKTSSILVNAAFYQALCVQEGWDAPINYSKAHGKTEEGKEVLLQYVHKFKIEGHDGRVLLAFLFLLNYFSQSCLDDTSFCTLF